MTSMFNKYAERQKESLKYGKNKSQTLSQMAYRRTNLLTKLPQSKNFFYGIQYKDTFYGVCLKGIEPIFVKKVERKNGSSTHEYGLFYPITRTKHKIYIFLQWKYLRYIKKTNPKKCAFCGEAPATRTIPDPNYDSELILNVCPDCIQWVFNCQLQTMERMMGDFKKTVAVKK